MASCSTRPLFEKAKVEEIAVIHQLGVWEVVDKPHDEVVYGTRWVDVNKGDEDKSYCRSQLVVQEYERRAEWAFLQCNFSLEALRSLICATIEELPDEVGQPVASTETGVLMLIDVRLAHSYSVARSRDSQQKPAKTKSRVGRLLRSMYGCRDAGVNWKFAICQVMIEHGFVHGGASPCIHHHSERPLRLKVHGDDLVPLGHISDVNFFFLRHTSTSLVLQVTTTVCALRGIVERTADGITWETHDMQGSSGSRTEWQVRDVSWHQRQG